MVELGETITVVNRSGKVVSTSKHLVNVFKEAQLAYREKKAELKAKREGKAIPVSPGGDGRRSPQSRSTPQSPHRASNSHRHSHRHGYGHGSRSGSRSPGHRHRYREEDEFRPGGLKRAETVPSFVDDFPASSRTRRHSDTGELVLSHPSARHSASSLLDTSIDMDLAYGEMPPPLPERRGNTEAELRTKMSTLTQMLEEAKCVQYSVSAMVKSLEKNPEAMAAVALTLAEISNLLSKAGPGALKGLKAAFPAAVALLASPEFAVAIGVGVGITIVALGGYKIIKRIKAAGGNDKKGEASKTDPAELEEIESDIGRIAAWRRGIDFVGADGQPVDADNVSVAGSVEGEFMTPGASRRLEEEGVLVPRQQRQERRARSENRGKDKKDKKVAKDGDDDTKKGKGKDKDASGLRMLFKRDKS